MPNYVENHLDDVVKVIAGDVEMIEIEVMTKGVQCIRGRTRVKTGKLWRSISFEKGVFGWTWFSDVDYAYWQEMGTEIMAAAAMFRRGVEDLKAFISGIVDSVTSAGESVSGFGLGPETSDSGSTPKVGRIRSLFNKVKKFFGR